VGGPKIGFLLKKSRLGRHGDDSAGAPNARFVANAFVALGLYHLDGIPGTLKADPNVSTRPVKSLP
jgi:hypothetical protein